MIYITSDLHLGHNKELVYTKRGFKSVDEMNEAIIKNINKTVKSDDDLYILGDLVLGGPENEYAKILEQLKCKAHIIRGNHDTDKRMKMYATLNNVVEICDAKYFRYGKYHFFMTHYPAITNVLSRKDKLCQYVINLFGHTHQTTNLYENNVAMYHVGVDSHNCKPILLDTIIEELEDHYEYLRGVIYE